MISLSFWPALAFNNCFKGALSYAGTALNTFNRINYMTAFDFTSDRLNWTCFFTKAAAFAQFGYAETG